MSDTPEINGVKPVCTKCGGLSTCWCPSLAPVRETGTDDDFGVELRGILNRHSAERGSDTPDHLLADFLRLCLGAFDGIVRDRDKWHGFVPFAPCGKCGGGARTSAHPCACAPVSPAANVLDFEKARAPFEHYIVCIPDVVRDSLESQARAAVAEARREAFVEMRDFCKANGFPFPVKYDGEILKLERTR